MAKIVNFLLILSFLLLAAVVGLILAIFLKVFLMYTSWSKEHKID